VNVDVRAAGRRWTYDAFREVLLKRLQASTFRPTANQLDGFLRDAKRFYRTATDEQVDEFLTRAHTHTGTRQAS
jgi:hypothetical protein